MIGIFDSGLGGLSVWREVARVLPGAPLLYLADQAHVPYGTRALHEVQRYSEACARWLIGRGCTVIVIACNTASAAALQHLRAAFPRTRFVGMEPALKPAAAQTRSGVIAVLATQATFQGRLFASLRDRFARDLTVLEQPCPDWVSLVEQGAWDTAGPAVAAMLEPLLARRADVFVLGCTHFPFLLPQIDAVLAQWQARHAGSVCWIDPAPAVARQTARQWQPDPADSDGPAPSGEAAPLREFWTTGDPARFSQLAATLLGAPLSARQVVVGRAPARPQQNR